MYMPLSDGERIDEILYRLLKDAKTKGLHQEIGWSVKLENSQNSVFIEF